MGPAGRTSAPRRGALRGAFDAARERGTAGTGLFGLRMQRGGFDAFADALAVLHPGQAADVARIEAEFGPTLLLHLTRPDRLGQAISRVRAEQTGLRHRRADGTGIERLAPRAEPRCDPIAIAGHLNEPTRAGRGVDRMVRPRGWVPPRITYDAPARDPRGALARVPDALGLDASLAASVDVPAARLADAISREWRDRSLAERAEDWNVPGAYPSRRLSRTLREVVATAP